MPRRKSARKNKCNESALTTRLIEISMRTDDHIYSNRLITAVEAAAYLQEIATLKLRCLPTNVRALQVIEKLTRHMSRIIIEDDTSYTTSTINKSFQMSNEFTRTASPVYSLPDEDRVINISAQNDDDKLSITLITDDDVSYKEMDISHGQMNTNKTSDDSSQVQNDSENTIDVIEVIDITNTSYIDEASQNVAFSNDKDINMEHVNTGISNMVIQDELSSQTPSNNHTFSQSIPDKCDNDITNKVIKEKERTKEIEMVSQKKMDAATRITKNVNNYFQLHTQPLAAMPFHATIASSTLMVSQPTIEDSGVKSKSDNLRFNFQEKTVKKGNQVTNKNNNKLKRRKTKKNTETKVDKAAKICLQNVPSTTMNSKHVSKNNCNDKENKSKTTRKSQNRKKVHEIYNENVENDLSWVENIRYIREISPSEYDPALTILPDNFWDNFALPGTWDDLDFDV